MEEPVIAPEFDPIGKSAIFQYLGSTSIVVGGALFYIFLIEHLTKNNVGAVNLMTAILGLFSIIMSLGFGPGLQHFISYYKARGDYGTVRAILRKFLLITVILGILSSLLMYTISPFIVDFFFTSSTSSFASNVELVRLLSVVAFAFVMNSILVNFLYGLQKFTVAGLITTSGAVLNFGVPSVLVLLYGGITVIVVSWIFTYSITSAVYLVLISRYMRKMGKSDEKTFDIRAMISYSVPILISNMMSFGAIYADRLTVAHLISQSVFAVYSLALLITSTVGFFIGPINSLALPKFSQYLSTAGREAIRRGVGIANNMVSFIYVPIAMLVSALSPLLIAIIQPTYESAFPAVIIILTATSIFVTVNVLGQAISGIRMTRVLAFSSAFSLASNVILSVVLIPRFQIIGAAIAYSSIYAVSFVIVYYYARMFGISCHNVKTLSKIWVSAILVFTVAFMMHTYLFSGSLPVLQTGLSGKMYGLFQAVVISVVSLTVYFISIRLTSTLKESDLEMLFSIMPKWLTVLKPLAIWALIRSSRRERSDTGY